ncbi:helix-turn-helix domain-containing protein [Desertibacillus haloalkaliphilus]|uniref:helix-turn-helix domain-containing protein n=1 Tax=Desertibacillus haloalkaliphilus TaxID=1328930 RepID=UPI001C26CDB5|nr:XRE family transcriptional regulator [Desertibacillus haloalkaliphilus]MBU8906144.1 XRE family transcriptional regulator [Desertibacillus haloalkaliphilus]
MVNKSNDAEKLARQVGDTLRRIRHDRKMSLQELATITEVSKLTLGNIERGEANPSLSVIWKIANGLTIPISTLLNEDKEVLVSRKNEGNDVVSTNGACTLQSIFDTSNYGSFEIHRAFLEPNSEYSPGAHQIGVIEYVTVMEGELKIKIQDEYHHLYEYDAIKFNGDVEHAYINPTDSVTVLHFVMTYTKPN